MKTFKSHAIMLVLLAVFLWAVPGWAQTSNTSLVLGTVTDPGGAVVPNATAELTNIATNEVKSVTTNSSGQYVFPNVTPGTYTLKISKAGFATTTFSNIQFDVSKSYTYDTRLEVSSGKEIVEVSAGAAAELQTVDAVVGNVVGESDLAQASGTAEAPSPARVAIKTFLISMASTSRITSSPAVDGNCQTSQSAWRLSPSFVSA